MQEEQQQAATKHGAHYKHTEHVSQQQPTNKKTATYLHANQAKQQADDRALHHHPRAVPHACHAVKDQLEHK
jgi:hypothetical protein